MKRIKHRILTDKTLWHFVCDMGVTFCFAENQNLLPFFKAQKYIDPCD